MDMLSLGRDSSDRTQHLDNLSQIGMNLDLGFDMLKWVACSQDIGPDRLQAMAGNAENLDSGEWRGNLSFPGRLHSLAFLTLCCNCCRGLADSNCPG